MSPVKPQYRSQYIIYMVVYCYNIANNVSYDAIVLSLSPYSCLYPFSLYVSVFLYESVFLSVSVSASCVRILV